MKNFRRFAGVLAVLVVSWLIAGCGTPSTVVSRKQERPAAYTALSPEFKTAVDQGQLKAGMNMDAVYIAWGNPAQSVSGGNQGGESTTWIYQAGYLQESRYWGGYRTHYVSTPMVYTRAQVVFVNGLVVQWQIFPTPMN